MTENKIQEAQIIDKMPFVNLLMQRINDVSINISSGGDGTDQIDNLLFSLPLEWVKPIASDIDAICTNSYNLEKRIWKGYTSNRITVNQRNWNISQNRKNAVRSVTQLIVSMLNDKGLLFSQKSIVEESNTSFKDDEV